MLTFKDMAQEEFSGKADDWKKWREGVEMYVERLMPGLKMRMDRVRDDEMEVPMETEGSEGTTLMQFFEGEVQREWSSRDDCEGVGCETKVGSMEEDVALV